MEAKDIYTIKEIVILLILTIIGTGAFLGFAFMSKKLQINLLNAMIILVGNLFVVSLVVESLRFTTYFKYHYIATLGSAYFGLYFLQYIDKRSFNLLDLLIKKTTNLEIEKSDNETQQKPQE